MVPLWSADQTKHANAGSKGDLATINPNGNGGCPTDYFVQGITPNSSRNIMGFGLYPKDGGDCNNGCSYVSAIGDIYNTNYLRGYTNSAKFLSSAAFTHLADECGSGTNTCSNFDAISGVGIGGRFTQEAGECKSNGFLGYYHFTNTGEFTQPVYSPIQVDPVSSQSYLSGSWLWHWIIDDVERVVGQDYENSNNNTVEVVDIVQGDNGFIYAAGFVAENCSSNSGEEYIAEGPYRPFIVKIKNIFTGHPESTHLYTLRTGESFKVNSLAVHDGKVYLVGAYNPDLLAPSSKYTAAIMRINQADVDDVVTSQHTWELYAPISDHESEASRIDFAVDGQGAYDNIIMIGSVLTNNWDPFVAVFPKSLQNTTPPTVNRVDAQRLELYDGKDIVSYDDYGRALLVQSATTGANGTEHDILLSGNHSDADIFPFKYHLTYRPSPSVGQNTLERTVGHEMRFYKGQGRNHDVFEKYISTGDYSSAIGLGWIRHDETAAGFWTTEPDDQRNNCCQSYREPALFAISGAEIYEDEYTMGYSKLYFYEFGQDIPFDRKTSKCENSATCTASEFVDCGTSSSSAPNPQEGALNVPGLESSDINNQLSIYPNPNEGDVTLMVEVDEAQDLEIALYDLQGKKLETLGSGSFASGSHTLNYSLNAYSNGTYFIRIEGTQWTTSQQVTINK